MKKLFAFLKTVLIASLLLGGIFPAAQADAYFTFPGPAANEQPGEDTPYFQTRTITQTGGPALEENLINGPPTPPLGYQAAAVYPLQPEQAAGIKMLPVPTYSWVFGCSAVSAAMIAAYYDRAEYANLYTGPTNGSVMPMDNSSWPTWKDGYGVIYPSNPLVASRSGLDGRGNQRGSIDDYWVKYLGGFQDPYMVYGWEEHSWSDAVGDYMKTSQFAYGNNDGATRFYNFLSGDALSCSQMEMLSDPYDPGSRLISMLDGTYGRKLFYQNRGYTVTDCYNQKTDNNGGGYTFARFKAEIDAGHPVLINLSGHSVVGVGYDDGTNTVYLHDTWDYSLHAMPWGGSYQGMAMVSVSIVRLAPLPPLPFSKLSPEDGAAGQPTNLVLSWADSQLAASYSYCYDTEDDDACEGFWTNVGTSTSASLTGLTNNTAYYWQVQAHNPSGMITADDSDWWSFITADNLPAITSFTPEHGIIGASVTITGAYFTGATAVKFNNASASFTVDSPTTINATVPAGAQTGKIMVETPAGTAVSSMNFVIPSVQFDAPTYTVQEDVGTAEFTISLSEPVGVTVTVPYSTSDGTAAAGMDYTAVNAAVIFAPGEISKTMGIEVLDDTLDESDSETLLLILGSPALLALGDPATASLIILDNDPPPLWHLFLPLLTR